jgi:D-methionine transport system substrate-binding protein
MRKPLARVLAATAAVLLAATACSSGDSKTDASPDSVLTVGVSPVPHAVILNYIKDNLAERVGLKLKVVEFNDYVQPNEALKDKKLDANYFQTIPYLDAQSKERGYKFTPLAPVHIEPLGIYSKKLTSLTDVPDGAVVTLSNDPANLNRGLLLLQANGLITLKNTGDALATELDVAENPHKLKLTPIDPPQLVRSLDDTDLAVINGNYALDAKLVPSKDALALESGENNPYANLVVVRAGDEKDPRIVKLEALLHSPEVKAFIEKTYPDGSVLPAF